jgi:hypothetical protein
LRSASPKRFARTIVWLCFVRSRPTLRDLREELLDIGLGDFRDELLAPVRRDQFHHHGFLVRRVRRCEPDAVLLEIAIDQVVDAGRLPDLIAFAKRVAAKVNLPAQRSCAVARSCHGPFWPAPEGHPALSSSHAIVKGEGSATTPIDANRKAADIVIEYLVIPSLSGDGVPHQFLCQAFSCWHRCTSFPRS